MCNVQFFVGVLQLISGTVDRDFRLRGTYYSSYNERYAIKFAFLGIVVVYGTPTDFFLLIDKVEYFIENWRLCPSQVVLNAHAATKIVLSMYCF